MKTSTDDEECEDCAGGGRLAGGLLLVIGIAAGYMGLDLITRGGLSRLIAGAAFAAGPAAMAAGDDDGQEGEGEVTGDEPGDSAG